MVVRRSGRLYRALSRISDAWIGLPQGPLVLVVALTAAVLVELVLLGEIVEAAVRHEAYGPGG